MKYLLLSIASLMLFSACSDDTVSYTSDYTTFVYTVNPADWVELENGEGLYYDVSAPEINYGVLDNGYFITYMNIGTQQDPIYYELPQTLVKTDDDGITYSEEFYPSYSKDLVRIEFYDTHPVTKFEPNRSYIFRTVVVSEPYILSRIKSKEIGTDYNSIMNALESYDIQKNEVILD